MRLILAMLCLALASCGNSGGSTPASLPAIAVTPTIPSVATSSIVFIGDSITLAWPLDRYITGAVGTGISGNETGQMLARFDTDVLAHLPQVVVILGGVNDIKNHDIVDTSSIFAMVQKAMASGAKVIVGTVMAATRLPNANLENKLILQFNEQLQMGSHEYGYTLVDFHTAMALYDGSPNQALLTDGLHPNDAGYDVMWSVLKPVLAHMGAL